MALQMNLFFYFNSNIYVDTGFENLCTFLTIVIEITRTE